MLSSLMLSKWYAGQLVALQQLLRNIWMWEKYNKYLLIWRKCIVKWIHMNYAAFCMTMELKVGSWHKLNIIGKIYGRQRRHITPVGAGSESTPQQTPKIWTNHHPSSRHATVGQEYEELDSTWSRQFIVAKETNSYAWMPSSIDEPAAYSRFPPRLIQKRTVLIMKDHEWKKGTALSNYQPITYLPTTWKVLSGIIAIKLTH